MAEKTSSSEAVGHVGGRARDPSGSTASLSSPPKPIEKSDNTKPVTLQGGCHGATAIHTLVNRTNNVRGSPQQAGSTEENLKNNKTVCERVPKVPSKLEEKHTTILRSSYVDKSTVKAEGAVRESETGVAQERSEDEVLVSSQDEGTVDELESWRNEESPDRFSDAVEGESYVENRSSLVTGHVLPLAYHANQINSQQVHSETLLIFPPHQPHSSEREPRNESVPVPFWWPVEQ